MPSSAASRDQRIARARSLAAAHPAAAEPLQFYAALTVFQKSLLADSRPRSGAVPAMSTDPYPIASSIDAGAVTAAIPALLRWLQSNAPGPLGASAGGLEPVAGEEWRALLQAFISAGSTSDESLDPVIAFVLEAACQPFAEELAAGIGAGSDRTQAGTTRCPACGALPLAAVLREEGQGARRSLVCGMCLTEWPRMRLVCPGCGEQAFEKLPVYTAEQFPHIRVDACDSCRAYVKTIDLTKDGLAIPAVDDIVTLSMDLWARDQGYRRLRPNLLAL